jgi:exodeoxyribonuclease VIII
MIDLETFSHRRNAAFFQFAVLPFDPHTDEIGVLLSGYVSPFDCEKLGLDFSASTLKFWFEQSFSPRFDGVPVRQALQIIAAVLNDHPKKCVWSQGSDFDFPILETAFEKCGIETPWAFWEKRDARTITALFPERCKHIPKPPNAHDAAADVLYQVRRVQASLGVNIGFGDGENLPPFPENVGALADWVAV